MPVTILRVAVFQRKPLFDDISGTIKRLVSDLDWCDKHDVKLAVFPECYLQGYASDRVTIARRAIALDGWEISVVLSTLTRYRTDVILGLMERQGEVFYNTAAMIREKIRPSLIPMAGAQGSTFATTPTSPTLQQSSVRLAIFPANIRYNGSWMASSANVRMPAQFLLRQAVEPVEDNPFISEEEKVYRNRTVGSENPRIVLFVCAGDAKHIDWAEITERQWWTGTPYGVMQLPFYFGD